MIENNTNNNVKTGEQRHGRLRLQVPRIVESGTVRDDNDVYDSENSLVCARVWRFEIVVDG